MDLGVISSATITAFDWQLRTGMSGSSGGTLLASGTIAGDGSSDRTALANTTVNGTHVFQYVFAVTNSTLANLTSGQTYWLTIYPEVSNGYNIWLPVTNHADAVNSLQDNFSHYYWYSWANPSAAGFYGNSLDYAVGLEGLAEAPEPSEAAALAAFLLLLGAARLGSFRVWMRKAACP